MATVVLIVGLVVFGAGIAGQIGLWREKARAQGPGGDRHGARIVVTVITVVIGAWLVIASAVRLLHSHSEAQHQSGVTATQQQ